MCVHFMPRAEASQNTSESFEPCFENWWAEGKQRYFQKKKICFQTCDLSQFSTKVVDPAVSIIQENSVDSGSLVKQAHPVELILQWPQLGESNKVGWQGGGICWILIGAECRACDDRICCQVDINL